VLWKKLILPPKSWPLIDITAPPSQTITKTISKSKVLSSAFVAADNTPANIRQKKNGPQRSQLRISFLLSASSATGLIGLITILSFDQILSKSLF
jgi:hypothetical protein